MNEVAGEAYLKLKRYAFSPSDDVKKNIVMELEGSRYVEMTVLDGNDEVHRALRGGRWSERGEEGQSLLLSACLLGKKVSGVSIDALDEDSYDAALELEDIRVEGVNPVLCLESVTADTEVKVKKSLTRPLKEKQKRELCFHDFTPSSVEVGKTSREGDYEVRETTYAPVVTVSGATPDPPFDKIIPSVSLVLPHLKMEWGDETYLLSVRDEEDRFIANSPKLGRGRKAPHEVASTVVAELFSGRLKRAYIDAEKVEWRGWQGPQLLKARKSYVELEDGEVIPLPYGGGAVAAFLGGAKETGLKIAEDRPFDRLYI